MSLKKIKRSILLLVGMVCGAIAGILQIIGLIRYAGRLPGDWMGIALYSATVIAFALMTTVFFLQWRRQRRREAAPPAETPTSAPPED